MNEREKMADKIIEIIAGEWGFDLSSADRNRIFEYAISEAETLDAFTEAEKYRDLYF